MCHETLFPIELNLAGVMSLSDELDTRVSCDIGIATQRLTSGGRFLLAAASSSVQCDLFSSI